jgi:hypothetical protein
MATTWTMYRNLVDFKKLFKKKFWDFKKKIIEFAFKIFKNFTTMKNLHKNKKARTLIYTTYSSSKFFNFAHRMYEMIMHF